VPPPVNAHPSAALATYRVAGLLLAPLLPFLLRARARRGKEDPARLDERFGHSAKARPKGTLIWVHGASVGECMAALPLVTGLVAAPGRSVLLTSGTVTSAKLMETRLPPGAFHQFVPVDSRAAVRRFLDHWQPDLAIFIDSELWPNMILEARARSVRLILANARLSEASFNGWLRAPNLARRLMSAFTACMAQDPVIAERLSRLGARDVRITGSLKADAPPLPAAALALGTLRAEIGKRPIFLAASTHPGEDDSVLQAAGALRKRIPDALTIIAPRHPERGAALAAVARGHGFETALRSTGALPAASTHLYVADTIGELGLFYRLVDFAFLGGSLIDHGGQNPLEAAKLHTAVLTGPHTQNFEECMAAILAAQGDGLVHDAKELSQKVTALITDPQSAEAMAKRAHDAVNKMGGALDATLALAEDILSHARS